MEIEIQPCAVLNLVEIIKLIIQRKVFFKLCQLYINHSISQRYIIAFSYFVAICKQFPFKTIEDYCNYKTYYYAFRQLFRPFVRKNYKKLINNCISVTKIGYFVELLSRMFKFKSMERIYIFSQLKEENKQLKAFCEIIMKIVLTLIRPHLRERFKELYNKINKNKSKEKEKDKEKEKEKPSLNIDIDTFEFIPFFQKKKNNSTRINSFMYESFDSKSNYSVHPNSVDNDILHQLQNYLIDKNKIEKSKINKGLKEAFLYDDDSNKSQENLYHQKRNNNIKINYLNPPLNINNKKSIKNKDNNVNNDENKKNNLILDIKKEETNEFSPINKSNLDNKNKSKSDQKIKIEKIKIIKSNNSDESNKNDNLEDIKVSTQSNNEDNKNKEEKVNKKDLDKDINNNNSNEKKDKDIFS